MRSLHLYVILNGIPSSYNLFMVSGLVPSLQEKKKKNHQSNNGDNVHGTATEWLVEKGDRLYYKIT